MVTKNKPNRKRPYQIIVRMSVDEYKIYQKKLTQSNLASNSYGIKCLTNKPVIQTTVEEIMALSAIQKQLSAIGNNVNQMARFCNAEGVVPSALALEELAGEVKESWRLLRQAVEAKH